MPNYLFDLIRSRMPGPDRRFLETSEGGVVNYGDLVDETARFANALVRLGIEPGDRVAVQVEKSPAVLFVYLPVSGPARSSSLSTPATRRPRSRTSSPTRDPGSLSAIRPAG